MHPSEADFKHMLIDLGVRNSDVARAIHKAPSTVTYYFRGRLKNAETRKAIKRYLQMRARTTGVRLPDFWPDVKTR